MCCVAEVGDHDSAVHHVGYISEFRLLPALVSNYDMCVMYAPCDVCSM